MKKNTVKALLYIAGMVFLAAGLVLNTKTGWGAAPLASVPYFFSLYTGIKYGNLTLVEYTCFVIGEFIVKGKNRKWTDVLQILYSIVFTRLLNLLAFIPMAGDSAGMKLLYVIFANLLAGTGSAMILTTHWITNPADSFVKALSERTGKDLGLIKNIVDCLFALFTVCISFILMHHLAGAGIGTIITAIVLGRVIWAFNKLFGNRITQYFASEEPPASENA